MQMSKVKALNEKEKRARLAAVIEDLKALYPDAPCALEYGGDGWRLLVMGRLSAQCTDARVNEVSKALFARFPNAHAMAEGELSEIEEIVKPCGLFRMKAANIKDSSRMLIERFDGEVPRTMDELLTLPGVGRKIANLLIGDLYGGEAVVCDTHCIRIMGRIGMYPETEKDPSRVEKTLRKLMDLKEGSDFCHRVVIFGREICTARNPACSFCPISNRCLHYERSVK